MSQRLRLFCRFAILAVVAGLLASVPLAAQPYNEALFKGMKWRLIGPFRGGRVLAVAGVPGDSNTYYFGAVSGGVWKTTDGGVTWQPLFDKQSVSSIGAIAVAESDPNVIYAGTGEACIRGNISYGDGVYKSSDGGKTWTNIGLRDTRHIGRLIVHPKNPDIVFVAALGHAYGPNAERGIFRSLDGGKTWQKVLYRDEKTGGIDISFDPSNPNILFAALWEAGRTPWSLTSGGPGSGLYRSADGGATWKRVEGNGLPKGLLGRIGVAVSGGDGNRVYALVEALDGGLFRSDDGGEHWTRVNDDHRFSQRAWYFTHVFADPRNPDAVYVLNTGAFRSSDGGKTFSLMPAPHGDHHGLWIDPTNPKRMINANDGGATITVDGGKSWTRQDNQPTAQFYHVAVDNHFPYFVYGTQQDNSSVGIASRTDGGGITWKDWTSVGGGESGYIAVDPKDSNIVYAGSYFGYVTRFDKRTNQAQNIQPWPDDPDGNGAAGLKYRWTWTTPIVISPHDTNVLYFSAQVLFRSTDGGMSWTAISPDLSRNDKSKQQSSGGPITKDNASVEFYDVIFSVAESPVQKDLIWVGTDDGWIHLTRDGGKNWTNVTPKDLPEWSMISLVEASPHDAGTAYLAVDRHKLDDIRPYIFRTHDFGKTWTKITTGLPEDSYVHAVREDPKRKGLLYAGTETGVFISFDDGAHWQPLQLNLPTTPVHDLVIKEDDLVAATHGRSFWILDDVTPLRQLEPGMAGGEVFLYTPRAIYRTRAGRFNPRNAPVGENPPAGVILSYYLKSAQKDAITLEILDGQSKVVRKFSSRERKEEQAPEEWVDEERAREHIPAEAGMNRWTWNLRYEEPTRIPAAVYDEGRPLGQLALPGAYQVKLTVGGKSWTTPFEVKPDPRVTTSPADLQKQFELMTRMRDRQSQMNDVILQIRGLRTQLQALRRRLAQNAEAKEVVSAAEALDKKMTAVEEELIQVKSKASEDELNYPTKLNSKLGYVQNAVDSADAAPTQAEYEVFEMFSKQLDEQLAKWNAIVSGDLAALNEQARKQNIPLFSLTAPGEAQGAKPR